MSPIAALLASLPAMALAVPIWDSIQHALAPSKTLADTKVFVYNQMPVDVSLYMTHQRGDDSDTKGAHNYGYIPAGDALDDYYPLTFETTRKDWDKWQAGIQFRDPDWFIWTDEFVAPLALEHANEKVGFTMGSSGITTGLLGRRIDAAFTITGDNFPKEAANVNCFLLLKVQNDFKVTTSVNVELMTRSDGWWQEQTFIQEKGNSNVTWLPFFFENNATKPYNDLFNFKVSSHGARALTTKLNPCELIPADSGNFLVATVNSTGWSIANYGDDEKLNVRCDGKWDARKNDVDGDDYEEDR